MTFNSKYLHQIASLSLQISFQNLFRLFDVTGRADNIHISEGVRCGQFYPELDEFYNPELIPWQAHDRWVKDGSKGMYMLAHEKVEELLAADPVSPVDANTEKVILEILEEAAAKL